MCILSDFAVLCKICVMMNWQDYFWTSTTWWIDG